MGSNASIDDDNDTGESIVSYTQFKIVHKSRSNILYKLPKIQIIELIKVLVKFIHIRGRGR